MEDLHAITERIKLLADPTRVRLLHLLQGEELTVGELAAILGQGQSSTSNHLARLREAGLVLDRRDGTRSYYRMVELTGTETAAAVWDLIAMRLASDPVLQADLERREEIVLARHEGAWVDRAAGSLDRRYVPGRSFESVAAALAQLIDFGDCIDMGSGDGALVDLLAPGSRTLTCVDLHPRMVESGKGRLDAERHAHVRFLEGDMQDPPLEAECADTVLFLQSLQYAERPDLALEAGFRLLRPGGRCLVLTLGAHEDQKLVADYGHRHHGFGPDMLATTFKQVGFTEIVVQIIGHDARLKHLELLLGSGRRRNGEQS